MEGLKDKPRAGRPSKLSEEDICSIKTTLKESNHGWTTKQVEGLIIRKSGIKYHHTHIYRIPEMGIEAEGSRKGACQHCIQRRERGFQKKTEQIFVVRQQEQERESFAIVPTDESFFFYDSLVRRVWIDGNKRPIVRVTGSHRHSCIFEATSIEGKQLFRQYVRFNGDTFLDYLKLIHAKFPKCHLFMDRASPHYKSRKVLKYFEENKDTIIPIYLPTTSPEFMVMEGCGTWPNGTCWF